MKYQYDQFGQFGETHPTEDTVHQVEEYLRDYSVGQMGEEVQGDCLGDEETEEEEKRQELVGCTDTDAEQNGVT